MELTGKENGIIKGNLYELDYPQHFREVVEKSLPADNYTLLYEQWGTGAARRNVF